MVRWSFLLAVLFLVSAVAGCSSQARQDGPTTPDVAQDVHVEATTTTGVIRGIVVDNAIRPLAGAHVTTMSKGQHLATNTTPNGSFGFQGLEPGTYFVQADKLGYKSIQTSVDVVAGVDSPKAVSIMLEANPTTKPYVETLSFKGFLACGVAVFATSIGCSIYPPINDATGSRAIFHYTYTLLPQWMQGELIWDQTQPAGGDLIWEAVPGGTNNPTGYRETTSSPALLYWNTTVLQKNNASVLKDGIDVRFFGGPHPLCQTPPPPSGVPNLTPFGCGVTLNQDVKVIVDTFYNFTPPAGWRHTKDGDPVVPA